jgi:hypothetical protein
MIYNCRISPGRLRYLGVETLAGGQLVARML